MGRYRKVQCKIWNDDKFPFCSDDCRFVFLHLLTTPFSTSMGVYKASLESLASEMRWPLKRYSKGFGEAFRKAFVRYDERHHLVVIPHWVRHNPPESPNVVRSWRKILDDLPPCPLLIEAISNISKDLESLSKGYAEAFEKPSESLRKAFGQPLPISEPEPEQEQDIEEGSVRGEGIDVNLDPPPPPPLFDLSVSPTAQECPPEDASIASDPDPYGLNLPEPKPLTVAWRMPCLVSTKDRTPALFAVSMETYERWRQAWPDCDVRREFGRMEAWLHANPGKMKTLKGAEKFIVAF